MSLHNEIMNIPAPMPNGISYMNGHRDARHAAAELAAEFDDKLEEAYMQNVGLSKDLAAAEKRAEEYEQKYNDLLMEVQFKWADESRHETAKRYIKERERAMHDACMDDRGNHA